MSAEYDKGYTEGFKAGLELNRSPVLDRDRRIRELVREWVGNGEWRNNSRGDVFKAAAEWIDKIDAAVIPPKGEVK